MIYISLGLFFLISAFLEFISKKNIQTNVLFIILCIILVLFAGLRSEIGSDWFAYFNYYSNNTGNFEFGYSEISKLFHQLHFHYNIFLIFINFISILLIGISIYKHSRITIFPLLLFFSNLYLYYNFSGMRQAVAISFTCFALNYAYNRNFLLFFLFVFFAFLFHSTAIVFLLVYFLPRKTINFKHLLILILIFIGLYTIKEKLFFALAEFKDVNFYTVVQEKSDSIITEFYIGALVRLLLIFVIIAFARKMLENVKFIYFFNIYIFGIFLFMSTYLISPDIGVRLSSYFTIIDIFLLGNILSSVNFRKKLAISMLYSIIIFYKLSWYSGIDSYYYKTIFNL